MYVQNAEELGGKSFEALISTAKTLENQIDTISSKYGDSFRPQSLHCDGSDFSVTAGVLCFDPGAVERFSEIIAEHGVTLTDFDTTGCTVAFVVEVDPKEWTPNE